MSHLPSSRQLGMAGRDSENTAALMVASPMYVRATSDAGDENATVLIIGCPATADLAVVRLRCSLRKKAITPKESEVQGVMVVDLPQASLRRFT